MKIYTFFKFVLMALLLTTLSLTVSAYDFMVDDIAYNIRSSFSNTVSVTMSDYNYSGNIIIPDTVIYKGNAYYVIAIGAFAFSNCTGLTNIEIPTSVTYIGEHAFTNCRGLTGSFTIPYSVSNIERFAFSECSGLTRVKIPNSVTSVGNYAFFGCKGLETAIIQNETISIGQFSGCKNLKNLIIGNFVQTIDNEAFCSCSSLKKIFIPKSVSYIDAEAFSSCCNLDTIIVDANNSTYDSRDNCNAIIETATNKLVTGGNCTIIPNTVTSIGFTAFLGRTYLTNITIPNSVTSISVAAFQECANLTTISIPNSVTLIKEWAFQDCSGLTTLNIGNSVTSIQNAVFRGCTSLNIINCFINDPKKVSLGSSVFYNVPKETCTLHVPKGSRSRYVERSQWKDFTNIIEDLDPPFIPGDVNGDEKVNVSDVTALINIILDVVPNDDSLGDVNGDERVNVSDVTALINIILGII